MGLIQCMCDALIQLEKARTLVRRSQNKSQQTLRMEGYDVKDLNKLDTPHTHVG